MKINLLTSDSHSSLANRLKNRIFTVIKNIFLTVISLLMVYPLYWLITSAFKTNDEFFSDPYSLPSTWVFENIVRAWEVADLGRAMINSTIVTVVPHC